MIDWSSPLCTSHYPPRPAQLLDGLTLSGRRRVAIQGDFSASCSVSDPRREVLTTFTYSENGISRTDGAPSEFDLQNVAAEIAQAA